MKVLLGDYKTAIADLTVAIEIDTEYSGHFDIRWSAGEPLMVPFLGTDLHSAIKEGTIKLIFSKGDFFSKCTNIITRSILPHTVKYYKENLP